MFVELLLDGKMHNVSEVAKNTTLFHCCIWELDKPPAVQGGVQISIQKLLIFFVSYRSRLSNSVVWFRFFKILKTKMYNTGQKSAALGPFIDRFFDSKLRAKYYTF